MSPHKQHLLQILWGPPEFIPVPKVNCLREFMPLKKHFVNVQRWDRVSIVPGYLCAGPAQLPVVT